MNKEKRREKLYNALKGTDQKAESGEMLILDNVHMVTVYNEGDAFVGYYFHDNDSGEQKSHTIHHGSVSVNSLIEKDSLE